MFSEQAFSGEYLHSIDEKGRLTIPVKFRPALAEGMYITRGLDGCLFVYPPQAWRALAEQVAKLPLTETAARHFSRMIFSSTECRLDKQGRILLPQHLREHAGLDNEAVIIGVNSRLEIWNPERWRELTALMEEQQFAEQLSSLEI